RDPERAYRQARGLQQHRRAPCRQLRDPAARRARRGRTGHRAERHGADLPDQRDDSPGHRVRDHAHGGRWPVAAGRRAWTRLGGLPAGTSDDHHDQDECLTPVNRRIFVIDTPGLNGSLNPTGVEFLGAGRVDAAATAAVWKLSLAEWEIARNRPLGIYRTPIYTTTFPRSIYIFY